jgi:enoyl-CoA hydratase/carnithine racemase
VAAHAGPARRGALKRQAAMESGTGHTIKTNIVGDGIAVLTLDRPQVLNAMSRALVADLLAALDAIDKDERSRVLVITGAGDKAFTAGGDIHEMSNSTPEQALAFQQSVTECCWLLANYRLPTLGAMNGLAYGGGALLAASLDIRIGCARTRFRFLGAQYGRLNSTWSLPLIVGWPQAKELLFSARVVEADEASRMGLLNHLVPAERLLDASMTLARQIARNPPDMVQGAKQLLHQHVGEPWENMIRAEREAIRTRLRPGPPRESFAEFLERKGAR